MGPFAQTVGETLERVSPHKGESRPSATAGSPPAAADGHPSQWSRRWLATSVLLLLVRALTRSFAGAEATHHHAPRTLHLPLLQHHTAAPPPPPHPP